jgi:hypothetical protein
MQWAARAHIQHGQLALQHERQHRTTLLCITGIASNSSQAAEHYDKMCLKMGLTTKTSAMFHNRMVFSNERPALTAGRGTTYKQARSNIYSGPRLTLLMQMPVHLQHSDAALYLPDLVPQYVPEIHGSRVVLIGAAAILTVAQKNGERISVEGGVLHGVKLHKQTKEPDKPVRQTCFTPQLQQAST